MVLDKDWFCENIHKYQESLYNIAFNILENEEDAKDAVQDTLYKAYSSLDTLRNYNKFKSWLFSILVNSSYEIIRKRKSELNIDDYSEILGQEEADNTTTYLIHQTIHSLDSSYRNVIILYYFEGLSIKEISEVMNISVNTTKKRLSRAREKLKTLLSEEEVYL